MPPEFWEDQAVRTALAMRSMGKVIRAYRLHPFHGRRPISQERAAGWVGITQAQLSRIENGPPIVHLDRLIQWALTLRIPSEMLWFALPPTPAREHGRPQPATSTPGVIKGQGRDFSLHPEGERLARTVSGLVATDATALSAVADVLACVRRLEDVTGPREVLPIARTLHEQTTRLASSARAEMRPGAVGLLSELEQYLGWLHMAPAVERWQDSRRHLDRAIALALESDDFMRLSTALSFAADRYLRLGEPLPALSLNEAASRDQRVHVAQRTFNAFHRARILAGNGTGRDVASALIEADKLTERLPPDDELPPSGYWYTPWFFHGERAFVLDSLGDHREASRLAREALTAIPEEWVNGEWMKRRCQLEQLTSS